MDRTMYDWVTEATDALGLPGEARWVDDREVVRQVLDLAREVAQAVARPAAPLGAFLAGVAVGLDPSGQGGSLERIREQLTPTLRDE